jgi:hypothetical protein
MRLLGMVELEAPNKSENYYFRYLIKPTYVILAEIPGVARESR